MQAMLSPFALLFARTWVRRYPRLVFAQPGGCVFGGATTLLRLLNSLRR